MIVKEAVTIVADSTLSTGANQYTVQQFTGELVGIRYDPTTDADTIHSTTTFIALDREGDTDHELWYKTIGSTDVWTYYPRHTLVDSTGVVMGVTTDAPVERFPLCDDRIQIELENSTAVDLTGTLTIYVDGIAGGSTA